MPVVKRPSGMKRMQVQGLIHILDSDKDYKDKKVLRTRDVMNLFNITRKTVRQWRKEDKDFAATIQVMNNYYLFMKEGLIQWLKKKSEYESLE